MYIQDRFISNYIYRFTNQLFLYFRMENAYLLSTFKTISFIYDIITYPMYYLLQKPWIKKYNSKKMKVSLLNLIENLSYALPISFVNYFNSAVLIIQLVGESLHVK